MKALKSGNVIQKFTEDEIVVLDKKNPIATATKDLISVAVGGALVLWGVQLVATLVATVVPLALIFCVIRLLWAVNRKYR